MGANVEAGGVADKREELRLGTIRFMRRIRAAISVIASHEIMRWIHANETKLSRSRKQPLLCTSDDRKYLLAGNRNGRLRHAATLNSSISHCVSALMSGRAASSFRRTRK